MVCKPVFEGEGVAFAGGDRESTETTTTLFIGHSNCAAVSWIRVAVAWIVEIENFFCEIEPSLRVEILRVVFPDHNLKFTLPVRDYVMIGLDGRGEVVGI